MAEPHTERRFQMNPFPALRVSRVLGAAPVLARGLGANARRWRWLRTALFSSYRPERHYMRGPGPKWREKHAHGAES
jgi:hypothetical protein